MRRKNKPQTRQLWWLGIPPKYRGAVWELSLPDELNITPELFSIFSAHAKQNREQVRQHLCDSIYQQMVKEGKSLGREDTASLIPLDLPRLCNAFVNNVTELSLLCSSSIRLTDRITIYYEKYWKRMCAIALI